jgi:hypothetical protein
MTATVAKQTGLGLGIFSLALGAAEVMAPRRIAEFLGLDPDGPASTAIRAFGMRELMAGALLVRGPAFSTNVWNRVIGDGMDLYSLALALRTSRKPKAVAGALAFVGSITALDIWTAKALDQETGRAFPNDNGLTDMRKR